MGHPQYWCTLVETIRIVTTAFSITCTTCEARLKVRDPSAAGQILACPKCGGMVQIVPPADWEPPQQSPNTAVADSQQTGSLSDTALDSTTAGSGSSSWALEVRPRKTPLRGKRSNIPDESSLMDTPPPDGDASPSGSRWSSGSLASHDGLAPGHKSDEAIGARRRGPAKAAIGGDANDSSIALSDQLAGAVVGGPAAWVSAAEAQWHKRLLLAGTGASLLIVVFAIGVYQMNRGEPVVPEAPTTRPPALKVTDEAKPTADDDASTPTDSSSTSPLNVEEATKAEALIPLKSGEDRLANARSSDEAHHQQLMRGLLSFSETEGAFPRGAAGVVQLAPESRLSWIATLLPFYDHQDWHARLNFRRTWSDPRNQPVTRETLALVVNPLLGPQKTSEGYPVTHYVGMAGVGADAGRLDAGDPRAGVFGYQRCVSREMIRDGLSNTLALVGVVDHTGPWASGGGATVRPFAQQPYINGPDGFGSGQPDGMVVSMADGSVRFLSSDTDPRVLEQMATIHDKRATEATGVQQPALSGDAPPAETTGSPTASTAEPFGPEDHSDPAEQAKPKSPAVPATPKADSSIDLTPGLEFEIAKVDFADVTLGDFIEFMRQLSALPMTLDVDALEKIGITPDLKFRVRMHDATVRQVLESVAAQNGLAIEVRKNEVRITAAARSDRSVKPAPSSRGGQ